MDNTQRIEVCNGLPQALASLDNEVQAHLHLARVIKRDIHAIPSGQLPHDEQQRLIIKVEEALFPLCDGISIYGLDRQLRARKCCLFTR